MRSVHSIPGHDEPQVVEVADLTRRTLARCSSRRTPRP